MKPTHPMRQRIFSLAAYLILAFIIAYIIAHRYSPGLLVGTPARLADKITLMNSGSSFALSSIKRPLLLNFWATWCTPCQQELPILGRLAKKYRNEVTFLGLSIDSPRADIVSLKNALALDYMLAEASSSIVKNWEAKLLPLTYLIDRTGHIVWGHAGLLKEEELKEALDKVIQGHKR